jgi:hypothetical protein
VVGSHFHLEAVDGKLVPSETCWPIYLPDLSPVTLKVKLVRLYHDNVVAVLRRAGLLPPQKEVTPQAPARLAARLDVGGTLVVVEAPDVAAFAGALTAPSTPDPSAASAPANVAEPIEPRAWYAKACKANPRRADESLAEHDQRIHRLMVKAAAAGTVTKLWKEETIGRQRRRRR